VFVFRMFTLGRKPLQTVYLKLLDLHIYKMVCLLALVYGKRGTYSNAERLYSFVFLLYIVHMMMMMMMFKSFFYHISLLQERKDPVSHLY